MATTADKFAKARRKFTTTVGAGGILAGGSSLPLASVTGLPTDTPIVLLINPGGTTEEVVKGVVSGSNVVSLSKGLEGTADNPHNAAEVVVGYFTQQHWNDLIDGILAHSNADGSLKTAAVKTALGVTSDPTGGWSNLSTAPTVATGYNKGNKEYLLNSSVDYTATLSPGMRLKLDRGTTPPTQSMSFAAASSQYATKASPSGITFTGAFACEAWIYLNSWTSTHSAIINRFDQGSGVNGWRLEISNKGQVEILYGNGSGFTNFITAQSVPLKQWVHVAGVVTSVSSKTGVVYINGVAVPTTSSLSAANTLVQASTDLRVGATAATPSSTYFDGYLSEVRLWSASRTATQIQDNMAVNLVGNETNLIALYKGSGNFTDTTSNANTLTASGGAVATQASNPYNSTEYAVVTKVTASTVTVFTGTDYNIPNMTLTNPFYSLAKAPFGFPTTRTKWLVEMMGTNCGQQSSPSADTWYNLGSLQLQVPTGSWELSYEGELYLDLVGGGDRTKQSTLSTTTSTETDIRFSNNSRIGNLNANIFYTGSHHAEQGQEVTAATVYYLLARSAGSSATTIIWPNIIQIKAKCAYI